MTFAPRHHLTLVVIAAFCVGILTSCASSEAIPTYQDATDTQYLHDDEGNLWDVADLAHQEMVKQNVLYDDPALQAYLKDVHDRLFPEFNGVFKLFVIRNSVANAFVMPNGYVYFNTGLLARLDNEAQLASILAHEGSHFVERHSLKQRRNIHSSALVSLAIGVGTGYTELYQLGTIASLSGYSQFLENEADSEGFARLAAAGYDIYEAVKPFQLLEAEAKALDYPKQLFFRSHPKMHERVESLSRLTAAHPGCLQPCDRNSQNKRFHRLADTARLDAIDSLHAKGDYKSLIFLLDTQNKLELFSAQARFYLADAFRLRGNDEDQQRMLDEYEATIQEAPDFAPTYRALGRLHIADDRERAVGYFKKYLVLAPNANDRALIEGFINE
ncbi:MAG: M48 family metalloprotease [Gammaproteobacteria bacterium]|nr:M48 family metalloprotease [Gammaproteobacteria bacterium]